MPRKWRFRIQDILDAVDRIERYTKNLDLNAFRGDEKTAHAVLYNLYVIGEAASRVPQTIRERYHEVDWARIRGLRNVIAHEYFAIHLDIIWQAATEDVPALKAPMRTILDREPDEQS